MMNARWDYGEAVRVIRNVRDDGTFAAFQVVNPTGMQPPVSGMAPGPGLRGGFLPSGPHQPGRVVIGSAVVPGGLDEEPAGVGVAGFRD